jgi:hypothetical protein
VPLTAELVGRFAREAIAAGEGEVCALLHHGFYLRFPGERYACAGGRALGCGPLNALVGAFAAPRLGQRIAIDGRGATLWTPPAFARPGPPALAALERAASGRVPREGLGCLVGGALNGVATHAQPALEALERWLAGNALERDAEALIGLGPGFTPSGDDFLGGMLVALRAGSQAQSLWRWLEPRLAGRTSAISAAHLAAAAEGEAHEALHACVELLLGGAGRWSDALDRLDRVGHFSGWDALAGVAAVVRLS